MTSTRSDNPGVIAPPPILYGLTLAIGIVLHELVPRPILPPPIAFSIGLALVGSGLVLALWARRAMRGVGTNINVTLAPGTYTLYCPILDHRQKGEELKLIIKPPKAPAPSSATTS